MIVLHSLILLIFFFKLSSVYLHVCLVARPSSGRIKRITQSWTETKKWKFGKAIVKVAYCMQLKVSLTIAMSTPRYWLLVLLCQIHKLRVHQMNLKVLAKMAERAHPGKNTNAKIFRNIGRWMMSCHKLWDFFSSKMHCHKNRNFFKVRWVKTTPIRKGAFSASNPLFTTCHQKVFRYRFASIDQLSNSCQEILTSS